MVVKFFVTIICHRNVLLSSYHFWDKFDIFAKKSRPFWAKLLGALEQKLEKTKKWARAGFMTLNVLLEYYNQISYPGRAKLYNIILQYRTIKVIEDCKMNNPSPVGQT